MVASFQHSYMQCGLISDPLTDSELSHMEQPGHKAALHYIVLKGELYSEGSIPEMAVLSYNLAP